MFLLGKMLLGTDMELVFDCLSFSEYVCTKKNSPQKKKYIYIYMYVYIYMDPFESIFKF